MEKDKNPMPEISILDFREVLSGAAHFLFDRHRHLGLSDHHNTGGGPALDRALYDSQAEALNNMNQVYFPEEVE